MDALEAVGPDIPVATGEMTALAVGVNGDGVPAGFAAMVGRSGVPVADLVGNRVATDWGGWVGNKVALAGNVMGAGVRIGSGAAFSG